MQTRESRRTYQYIKAVCLCHRLVCKIRMTHAQSFSRIPLSRWLLGVSFPSQTGTEPSFLSDAAWGEQHCSPVPKPLSTNICSFSTQTGLFHNVSVEEASPWRLNPCCNCNFEPAIGIIKGLAQRKTESSPKGFCFLCLVSLT